MRIQHIAESLDGVGGVETFVRRVSTHMTAAGHDVHVVHGGQSKGDTAWPYIRAQQLLGAGIHQDAMNAVIGQAYRINPDLVIGHHLARGSVLRTLSARYPTIAFLHGFVCGGGKLFRHEDVACTHRVDLRCMVDWYRGPCGGELSPISAARNYRQSRDHLRALSVVTAVAVPSRFLAEYAIREGIDVRRVVVVDNATGIGLPAPPRPGPRTKLIYVGRLTYVKGVQYLLNAMCSLPSEFTLAIVGDGWYRPALEGLSTKLDLERRVNFHGELRGEALDALLRGSHLAIVPSIWPEPAGLVVPEARAAGLPVVASDVGGLPEWGPRLGAVMTAPPADGVALAEVILEASTASFPETPTEPPPPSLLDLATRLVNELRS